ncbi:MAG: Dyp-type peroxidase [Actinomycetes bacterium]
MTSSEQTKMDQAKSAKQTLTRRAFVRGTGLSAGVLVTAAACTPGTPPAGPGPNQSTPTGLTGPTPELQLSNIQGNILAGFNKDHQRMLFFTFPSGLAAKQLLSTLQQQVANSEEVLAFNSSYKAAASSNSPLPTATWLNLALTHAGLTALGVSRSDLQAFPDSFRQGMRARSGLIGDSGPSAPSNWITSNADHAVVILAADRLSDLSDAARTATSQIKNAGGTITFDQTGAAREDEPGHEHFGFKDGVSQPGIRGVTTPNNPDDPNQGVPGQDLLWPGEFVLGYPTQIPTGDGLNVQPGPLAVSGPAWTTDGSYLVFRRLQQDVAGFQSFISGTAATAGMSEDLFGAKLVGRYKSGCPLERTEDQPVGLDTQLADPSILDPSILQEDKINHFEFGDDVNGNVCPRSAHVRKTYPRDDQTPTGGEAASQTHRILRRGIPFGASYLPESSNALHAADAAFPHDRGLLFLCYQSSIERQFEFVQNRWSNDEDFPTRGSGEDPIISQNASGVFQIPGSQAQQVTLQGFVTTTGGDYFFQPSIEALQLLATPQAAAAPTQNPAGRPPRNPI